MEDEFKKSSGTSLIIGCVSMVLTMVLHPSGGNIAHLLNIKPVLIGSHALAIASMPFIAFGFWGLSTALLTKSRLSMLAFGMACFSLVAGMLAAAINGLVLPFFLTKYYSPDADMALIKAILNYNGCFNIAMNYILIVGVLASMGVWSVLMIRTARFTQWLGYYGIVLIGLGVLGLLLNFNFVDLWGFRTFVFGITSWMVWAGLQLR